MTGDEKFIYHTLSQHVLISSSYQYCFSPLASTQQRSLSFTSCGVLQDNEIICPRLTQLLGGCALARSWWDEVVPSTKAGRAHDNSSSGSPALPVTVMETKVLINKFSRRLKCSSSCSCPSVEGGGTWAGFLPHIYVCGLVCESKWKRETSALTAPVPRQNARRGLRQVTNRNQTNEEWAWVSCTAPEGTTGQGRAGGGK